MSAEQTQAGLHRYYEIMGNVDAPALRYEWLVSVANYVALPIAVIVQDYNHWAGKR